MKTFNSTNIISIIAAFLLLGFAQQSFADNAYCQQMANGQTRCNTFRDDGSNHSEYWSAPVNGRSYKSADFDDRDN
tara:strand:+ start:1272 stop:1499 length:228 start_codon:yes stop_codon:yes gene_type:complete